MLSKNTTMYYFKIKTGYGDNDFISIVGLEDLEKAQYAFMTNSKVVFSNGELCRGQDIISIKEDWNRAMCWNVMHKMTTDDYAQLRSTGIENKYKGLLAQTKNNVQMLVSMNRQDLIGKESEERIKLLL